MDELLLPTLRHGTQKACIQAPVNRGRSQKRIFPTCSTSTSPPSPLKPLLTTIIQHLAKRENQTKWLPLSLAQTFIQNDMLIIVGDLANSSAFVINFHVSVSCIYILLFLQGIFCANLHHLTFTHTELCHLLTQFVGVFM